MNLSVVIPAYNEAKRIGATLETITAYLHKNRHSYEIIVVDDCSKDSTSDVVQQIINKDNRINLLRNNVNRGKGYSVKRGILAAKNDFVLFSDADLSTPIEEIEKLEQHIYVYDIVIASRNMKGSDIKVRQPFFRSTLGRIFPLIVNILLLPKIRDTQCGFKLFKSGAAKEIFQRLTVERFAFDVEALFIAKKHGFKIKEVPVVWINDTASKVSPLSDSISMLSDVIRIRLNDLSGKYNH